MAWKLPNLNKLVTTSKTSNASCRPCNSNRKTRSPAPSIVFRHEFLAVLVVSNENFVRFLTGLLPPWVWSPRYPNITVPLHFYDENGAKTEAKPTLRHQCEPSKLSTSYTRFGEKRVFRSYCDHIGFDLPEQGAIILVGDHISDHIGRWVNQKFRRSYSRSYWRSVFFTNTSFNYWSIYFNSLN